MVDGRPAVDAGRDERAVEQKARQHEEERDADVQARGERADDLVLAEPRPVADVEHDDRQCGNGANAVEHREARVAGRWRDGGGDLGGQRAALAVRVERVAGAHRSTGARRVVGALVRTVLRGRRPARPGSPRRRSRPAPASPSQRRRAAATRRGPPLGLRPARRPRVAGDVRPARSRRTTSASSASPTRPSSDAVSSSIEWALRTRSSMSRSRSHVSPKLPAPSPASGWSAQERIATSQ